MEDPNLELGGTRATLAVVSFRHSPREGRRKADHQSTSKIVAFGDLARRCAKRLRKGQWISANGLFVYGGEFDLYAADVEVLLWKPRRQTLLTCSIDVLPEKEQ